MLPVKRSFWSLLKICRRFWRFFSFFLSSHVNLIKKKNLRQTGIFKRNRKNAVSRRYPGVSDAYTQTHPHTHTPWQQVRRLNSTGAHLVGPGVRMPFFFLIGADSRWSRDKHVRLSLERELKWLTDTNLCLTPHHRETQDEPDQRLHQNNSQLFPPCSEEELERLHLPHLRQIQGWSALSVADIYHIKSLTLKSLR